MDNDLKLSQLIKVISLIIYKALLLFFMALYLDYKKSRIKQEPKFGIHNVWEGWGLISIAPLYRSFPYSYIKNNYHYILRPKRIPTDIPRLLENIKNGDDDYHFYFWDVKIDLPTYIMHPYSGPDNPARLPDIDFANILKPKEVKLTGKRILRVA